MMPDETIDGTLVVNGELYVGPNGLSFRAFGGTGGTYVNIHQRGVGAGGDQQMLVSPRVASFIGPEATASTDQWDSQAEIVLTAGVWDGTHNTDKSIAIGAQADPANASAMLVFDIPNVGEVVRLRYPGSLHLNQPAAAPDGFVVNEDSWGRMANLHTTGVEFGPKGGPEDTGIRRLAAKVLSVIGDALQLPTTGPLPTATSAHEGEVRYSKTAGVGHFYGCKAATTTTYSWVRLD